MNKIWFVEFFITAPKQIQSPAALYSADTKCSLLRVKAIGAWSCPLTSIWLPWLIMCTASIHRYIRLHSMLFRDKKITCHKKVIYHYIMTWKSGQSGFKDVSFAISWMELYSSREAEVSQQLKLEEMFMVWNDGFTVRMLDTGVHLFSSCHVCLSTDGLAKRDAISQIKLSVQAGS